MLIAEIAQYLAAEGIGIFDEVGGTSTIWLFSLPDVGDDAVMIRPTGGVRSDVKLPFDTVTVQCIVRGTQDARGAADRAQAIYDLLHGFKDGSFVSGGLWIVGCSGIQAAPAHIGTDSKGRHEFSLNFQLIIKNDNRRAI